jgi:hypothetical protein
MLNFMPFGSMQAGLQRNVVGCSINGGSDVNVNFFI